MNRIAYLFSSFFRFLRLSREVWSGMVAAVAYSFFVIALNANCGADDWPMWRQNSGRTGATSEGLADSIVLKWVRHLPVIEPAFHSARLQFDAGYDQGKFSRQFVLSSIYRFH